MPDTGEAGIRDADRCDEVADPEPSPPAGEGAPADGVPVRLRALAPALVDGANVSAVARDMRCISEWPPGIRPESARSDRMLWKMLGEAFANDWPTTLRAGTCRAPWHHHGTSAEVIAAIRFAFAHPDRPVFGGVRPKQESKQERSHLALVPKASPSQDLAADYWAGRKPPPPYKGSPATYYRPKPRKRIWVWSNRPPARFTSNYVDGVGWLTAREAEIFDDDDATISARSGDSIECEVDSRFVMTAPHAPIDSWITPGWFPEGREVRPRMFDEFGTALYE